MTRLARRATTAAILAALVLPVALDHDSFPLSTYPMYSRTRPSEVTFATARGIDPDGASHRLSLAMIGASDDPLIVESGLRSAIDAGRADERCRAIATRAVGSPFASIEVALERHDVVARAEGRTSLTARDVRARCRVG